MNRYLTKALEIITKRFGRDTLLSLATIHDNIPSVRIVNSYYENCSFYTVTNALSGKMKDIEHNAAVGVCGEWFTAHGTAQNMGYVCAKQNTEIAEKLRAVFAEWYFNGHIDENDTNTIILRIELTDAVLFSHGTRYDINFSAIDT